MSAKRFLETCQSRRGVHWLGSEFFFLRLPLRETQAENVSFGHGTCPTSS